MEAGDAAGLVLTIASETFEESGRSLVRGTLDYLQGLKVCPLSIAFSNYYFSSDAIQSLILSNYKF